MAFFETIFPSLISDDPSNINSDLGLVSVTGSLGGPDAGWTNISVKEVALGESLITPGLQTAITFQSFVYDKNPKILSELKNSKLTLKLYSPLGERKMDLGNNHKIYRVDNRSLMPSNVGQTEEFTIHACDDSLLRDAQTLVSKSWKCTTPSDIVDYVLRSCVGANEPTVDDAQPARDYIAEKIHPFQVIAQQANVALDGDDPSFVHYMTYENGGTHYFRSLKKMSKSEPVESFEPYETAALGNTDYNKNSLYNIINFSFPCDFDYLSDLLNGIDENGENLNVLGTFNPLSGAADFLGGNFSGSCGKGANYKQSMTNKGTAEQQSGCETDVEKHLLKRQARMGLLERDKTALRMTIPWNPNIHVGQVITFKWPNKIQQNDTLLYGSGDYIISSLMHRIMFGGYATTTLDCITRI